MSDDKFDYGYWLGTEDAGRIDTAPLGRSPLKLHEWLVAACAIAVIGAWLLSVDWITSVTRRQR